MAVSLEGREPLLDYRIIEFAARLDPSLKIHNGTKKYLLKNIAYKYIPRELLERPKMGFAVPVTEWCREELRKYVLCYLDKERIKGEGFFNADKIDDLCKRYFEGKLFITKIWHLLMFEMWKERWMP
jgi:asparagine synthase (glutamine-hydrolysing)